MFVAGIDGGQSSTVAVIADERGRILGRGVAGPADEVGEAPGSTRVADAVHHAVAAALRNGERDAATPLDAVVIGLSGYEGTLRGAMPAFGSARVRIVHDAPIALVGATRERPAVVTIGGTGSVAYGEDAHGRSVRIGGWGAVFGDEGSSYALARDALMVAMRAEDRGDPAPLAEAALAYFDVPNLRAVQEAVAARTLDRARLAGFARLVHVAARLGDPAAAHLIDLAADALARIAVTAAGRISEDGPVALAFVGGAFGEAAFRTQVETRSHTLLSRAVIVAPEAEPAVGAARLALNLAAAATAP